MCKSTMLGEIEEYLVFSEDVEDEAKGQVIQPDRVASLKKASVIRDTCELRTEAEDLGS